MARLQDQPAAGGGPDLSHVDWSKVGPDCLTLPALLGRGVDRFSETELVVYDGERLTYAEAAERSAELAATLLAAGIGRGSRVALMAGNGVRFTIAWLAIVRIGAVAIPISTLSSFAELRRILAASGATLLLTAAGYLHHDFAPTIAAALNLSGADPVIASPHAPLLRQVWTWAEGMPSWCRPIAGLPAMAVGLVTAAENLVTPADEISIIFTSGSTSAPKGVIHTHGSFLRSAQRWAAAMVYQPGDRVFNAAPMFWVGGLITALLTLMEVGATLVGCSGDDGEVLSTIQAERCTLVGVSALAARRLALHPAFAAGDFSRVRASSVREMPPPHLRTRNQIYFGNALGMTETAGPHTVSLPDVDDAHIGSMGPLAPGMEHRLVDPETRQDMPPGEPGELLVRGDTLMQGYVGRERAECFDANGWFATGDLCSWRDGHLFLHGRLNAIIKVSGANVAPAEVEAALAGLPGVGAVAVVGLPDAQRGQIVAAVVVPKSGAGLEADDIVRQVRPLLSSYKVPRRVLVAEAIPLTATGKPDLPGIAALFG